MKQFGLILIICLQSVIWPVAALGDPAPSAVELEQRAKQIGRALRCVVCQNQSIDESDAPLAGDMRRLVRQRLQEGQSNEQIIDFMRGQYGDYVLLKPPVQRNTFLLWFGPLLALLAGAAGYVIASRKAVRTEPLASLSLEEQARLKALRSEDDL